MNEGPRTALVTGGAKRVGRAIVRTLAEAGFDVLFTTRDATVAPDEPAGPTPTGGPAPGRMLPLTIDITDPHAADAIRDAIEQTFSGRLDVLVHNASIYERATLAQTGIRLIRRFNRIHVEIPILLTKALAGPLRATRGHVILMLDQLAERPPAAYMAYAASKAAMANLVPSLARELSPEVTVNGIAPGVVEWPADMPEADRQAYLRRVPLARAGTPADAASLVRYLVTDGRYITGQVIRVDGGRSVV
jgi:pteridine reductase